MGSEYGVEIYILSISIVGTSVSGRYILNVFHRLSLEYVLQHVDEIGIQMQI